MCFFYFYFHSFPPLYSDIVILFIFFGNTCITFFKENFLFP
nr:hypothetical protein YKEOBPQY_YKEOBPQY_CDS_0004 [Microvirus sp.]